MKNKISNIYKKTFTYAKTHKIQAGAVVVIILGLGYWAFVSAGNTSGATKYVLSTVQKGTIISSVSGSGQVSATNQVDVKAKVSGDITWVAAVAGQTVRQGQAL